MKNKILTLGIACFVLISFAFSVSAEEVSDVEPSVEMQQPAPQMNQGEMPQRDMPAGGMGQMGERPERGNMEQNAPSQDGVTAPQENNVQQNTEATAESGETNTEESVQETEQMMQGEFNPADMEANPFGENMQTSAKTEKPYEKWITPIISALAMIFGFVFVALYKRKQI